MTETNTDTAAIARSEASLIAKYGDKIVAGTVRRAPEGSPYGNKMLVDINTRGIDGQPDGNTRTVATSDVFQVYHTEEVATELRKVHMAEKRAAAKAAAKAAKAPAKPKAKTPRKPKTAKAAAALDV